MKKLLSKSSLIEFMVLFAVAFLVLSICVGCVKKTRGTTAIVQNNTIKLNCIITE